MIHDDTTCELGEGPLWHPERQDLFWFDILGQRLLSVLPRLAGGLLGQHWAEPGGSGGEDWDQVQVVWDPTDPRKAASSWTARRSSPACRTSATSIPASRRTWRPRSSSRPSS